MVIGYLPAILHGPGAWIVVAMLAYGAAQVTGTAIVPRVIRRRGARAALLLGACAITAITAALILTRSSHPAGTLTMAALGLAVGLTIASQQHRLFATVPALARSPRAQRIRHLHGQRPRSRPRRPRTSRRRPGPRRSLALQWGPVLGGDFASVTPRPADGWYGHVDR